MTLTASFDNLVRAVFQVQRKCEALVDKLHYINSDVHGGAPDMATIEQTLADIELDLPELCESAALPLEACAAFSAEVGRVRSEEDALHRLDGATADDAGAAAEAAAASLASAEVSARPHEHHGGLRQTDAAGTTA